MGDQNTIDLENRDPNGLNTYVQVAARRSFWKRVRMDPFPKPSSCYDRRKPKCQFEDVLGEPEGAHSIGCCWKFTNICYNCSFKCCYILLTLCGPLYGLCYGWQYAYLACMHIWGCTPSIKACEINCHMLRKVYSICLSCFLTPFCESCGSFFSKIQVKK